MASEPKNKASMNNVNNITKPIRIISFLLVLMVFYSKASAQKLEISYKLDSLAVEGKYQYHVTVKIKGNSGNYNISFLERLPNLNYNLLEKKENLTDPTCIFIATERRRWMVVVECNSQTESKIIK